MSSHERPLGRVMALDLGARRVGVAFSDETQTLATPYQVIVRTSFAQLLERLARVAEEQNAGSLLVGLPLSVNGENGSQAGHVRRVAVRLATDLRRPVLGGD